MTGETEGTTMAESTPTPQTAPNRGRPVLGAIAGLLFGLFLTFDLLMFSVFPFESVLVLVIPVLGLLAGVLLGWTAPLRALRR